MSDAFGPDDQRPGGAPPPAAPPPGAPPPPAAPPPGAPPPPSAPPPGAPPAWSPGPPPSTTDSNGVALGAAVTGIASLLFALIGAFVLPLFLSIPGGLVAVVLGVIGRRRAKAGAPRSGQATAGLVTGILALVVSAVWIGVGVVFSAQFISEFSDEVAELEACLEETGDPEVCSERFSEEVFDRLEP